MRLKKLGLAIAVVSALGAILVSSALGAIKTEEAEWYTGNPTATLKEDKAVTLAPASHVMDNGGAATTNTTFKVQVGTNLYWLQATGVECVGCKITNGSTNAEKAMAKGKIKFTGVTVLSPSTVCKAGSGGVVGTVETKEITAHADWMHEGKAYVKFEPTAGPTSTFVTVEVTGCAAETPLPIKGYVFGEALNKTEVAGASQGITFNEAIHKTTESTLNVNTQTALLDGGVTASIGGTEFGVK